MVDALRAKGESGGGVSVRGADAAKRHDVGDDETGNEASYADVDEGHDDEGVSGMSGCGMPMVGRSENVENGYRNAKNCVSKSREKASKNRRKSMKTQGMREHHRPGDGRHPLRFIDGVSETEGCRLLVRACPSRLGPLDSQARVRTCPSISILVPLHTLA